MSPWLSDATAALRLMLDVCVAIAALQAAENRQELKSEGSSPVKDNEGGWISYCAPIIT